ncbi:MAG: Holliday junction branch migration protein RuvA [Polyangiaceae bacterium]|nr:Holliday junction branch migration protein RuvA [Polyangiaceae bacterium]
MIGRLTGIVAGEDVDGTILLDVGGVGYEILVPLGSLGRADKDEQGRTTLIIHTHVREDAFTLFGFATPTDRLVFRTLVGISGVGPKTAVGVLSALSTEELAAAIAREDTKLLTSVPGIGKKTAERLLLELRDKVAIKDIASEVKTSTKGVAKPQNSKRDILLGALVNMGYKDAQAQRAISSLGEIVDTAELPVLLRESLALLRKS